jgi:multiple sugar transport system ATP-binding protein
MGMTMIYVTHDQIDAMSLAQRVAVMNEGKLCQIAEPMRIYREPADAFVAGFLGTPAMNFFHGQLGPESGALLFSEEAKASQMPSGGAANAFQVELPLEKAALRNCAGKAVLMGLRPEDITISIGNEPATIEAVIEKVEHLGPEVHVHARTAGHSFVLRQITSFAKELSEGAKALFEFNLKCAHFFDAASGARLG